MTTQTLTPTVLSPDDALTDLTTLVTTTTGNVLEFSNSGRELLVLQATAASQTATVSIGATVLGQAVQSFDAVDLPYPGSAGGIVLLGPFHSALETPGTTTVTVTMTDATSKAALIQVPGVS
jgi:hypothetical protein